MRSFKYRFLRVERRFIWPILLTVRQLSSLPPITSLCLPLPSSHSAHEDIDPPIGRCSFAASAVLASIRSNLINSCKFNYRSFASLALYSGFSSSSPFPSPSFFPSIPTAYLLSFTISRIASSSSCLCFTSFSIRLFPAGDLSGLLLLFSSFSFTKITSKLHLPTPPSNLLSF